MEYPRNVGAQPLARDLKPSSLTLTRKPWAMPLYFPGSTYNRQSTSHCVCLLFTLQWRTGRVNTTPTHLNATLDEVQRHQGCVRYAAAKDPAETTQSVVFGRSKFAAIITCFGRQRSGVTGKKSFKIKQLQD